MTRSEILLSLSRHLSVRKLIAEYPGLDRRALAALLEEAAAALGGAELAPGGQGALFSDADEASPAAKASKGELMLFTDGASRGNPGEAGIGAVIKAADGAIIGEIARYLGQATNNAAEYSALLVGVRAARTMGATRLRIFADSELVVKQIKGEYRVKNEGLRPLFESVKTELSKLDSFVIQYIPRSKNAEADALANKAIDNKMR